MANPKTIPAAIPPIISKAITNKIFPTESPFPASVSFLAIVEVTENKVILKISLKLEAAIKIKGIPFLIPYPLTYKFIIQGTKTAGETAPIIDPKVKANFNSISNHPWATRATTIPSITGGTIVKRTTTIPIAFIVKKL